MTPSKALACLIDTLEYGALRDAETNKAIATLEALVVKEEEEDAALARLRKFRADLEAEATPPEVERKG